MKRVEFVDEGHFESDLKAPLQGRRIRIVNSQQRDKTPVSIQYRGKRVAGEAVVTRTDSRETRFLNKRDDLKVFPQLNFEWSEKSEGAEQLALALLADVVTENVAINIYEEFAWKVVARFSYERWAITSEEIRELAEGLLENYFR